MPNIHTIIDDNRRLRVTLMVSLPVDGFNTLERRLPQCPYLRGHWLRRVTPRVCIYRGRHSGGGEAGEVAMVRDGGCRLLRHVFIVEVDVGGSCGRVTRFKNHTCFGVLHDFATQTFRV
jgi:hypothetical protein